MKHEFFFLIGMSLLLIGCAGMMSEIREVEVESSQTQKPPWVNETITVKGEYIFATGHSRPKPTDEEAKDDAVADAAEEIAKYIGITVEALDRSIESSSIAQGKEYFTSDFEAKRRIRTKAFIKRALPTDWYVLTKARMKGDKKIADFYQAWVYLRVLEEEIERIQEEKNIKLSMDIGLYFEDETGKLQYLTEGSVLHSKDAYALYVRPTDNCYLYFFQVDDLGRSYRLFPNTDFNTADNPLVAGKDYWIPNTEQYFVLDETTGKEQFYLFASPERIIELEGSSELNKTDVDRVLKTMGVGGLKDKLIAYPVQPPKKQVAVAEVKKKLQAEGAFVWETWFWHR